MQIVFFLVAMIFVVVGNVVHYWLKSDLKERGYKTYKFRGHLTDLFNARNVILKTDDINVKKTYRTVLYSIIICMIGLVICFILIINFDH